MRQFSRGPARAVALAVLTAICALSAAKALAEDWTVVETFGEPVEFRVAGPATWRAGAGDPDGAVIRAFLHEEREPLLRRGLAVTARILGPGDGSTTNPGDLPEPSLAAFAAKAAEEMTAGRTRAQTRLVSHDVVGISGVNALRIVVESVFDAPEGRILELIEAHILSYERKGDGSPVALNLACSYAGLADDRPILTRRFEAERGPVRKRFAGSLAILDGRAPATTPPPADVP